MNDDIRIGGLVLVDRTASLHLDPTDCYPTHLTPADARALAAELTAWADRAPGTYGHCDHCESDCPERLEGVLHREPCEEGCNDEVPA